MLRTSHRHECPPPLLGPISTALVESEMDPPNEGFAALAERIARDHDNETFIFRKFDRLAARNLLHLQGRVMLLEKELDALDREAAKSHDMSIKEAARS